MSSDNLESHIEEILDVLKENSENNVNKEDLEKELKKFIEYGVPIDQAKQTLIKKFGGNIPFISSERKLISTLQPNESSVNLLCRIIAVNPKDISVKGENRTIFYGIIGDESGTIPFTAWKNFEIEKGDVVEISNAYTKEWQGSTQLNFGDRVKITKTDNDKLPESAYEAKEFKVEDLRSGLGSVDVTVKIIDITEREAEVNGEKKKVFSGIIGDETGKAQFTSWHNFKFKEGDVFRISGGYVKSWKGIPQLTFDDKAKVTKLDKLKIPEVKVSMRHILLHQLVEKRGGLDIEVEGAALAIREGSGLISRCPECNRVLQNEQCNVHGNVKGKPDLRIKLIVDDGSGSVTSILNRETSEKILGKTLEDYQKIANNSKNQDEVIDDIHAKLFARKIKLQGNALGDDFGTTIIVKHAEILNVDIKNEANKISQELEELL